MPLYDFDCGACGARFEELVPVGAVAACPACGSQRIRRAYSPISPAGPGVALRGQAARESDARRREREARRQEGFAAQRGQRG